MYCTPSTEVIRIQPVYKELDIQRLDSNQLSISSVISSIILHSAVHIISSFISLAVLSLVAALKPPQQLLSKVNS
jgi:hypothetical protein